MTQNSEWDSEPLSRESAWDDLIANHPDPPREYHQLRKGVFTVRERRREEQQELLRLVQEGKRRDEALSIVGVDSKTLDVWRKSNIAFGQAWAIAIKHNRDARNAALEPLGIRHKTFSWKRKKFFDRDTPDYQAKFIDVIETTKPGNISLILCPPGVGKTLTIEDWVSIAVGEDPNIRILYISETDDHPTRIVRHIRDRMNPKAKNEWPDYHLAYGPFVDEDDPTGQKWTETEFTVVQCDRDEHSPTFFGTGWSGQIASLRADLIILDDMQTQATLGQTDKMMERLQGTILSRTRSAAKPKIVMIAQRVGVDDLAGTMMREGMVKPENIIKMPLCSEEFPDRSQFYPWITHEEVAEIKRLSPRMFETMYQQNPESTKDQVFSEALAEFWDESRHYRDDLFDRNLWGTVTTVDPATTGGSCVLTMSFDENNIYGREMFYKYDVLQLSRLENEIIAQVIRYDSKVVVVEAKAAQMWLATSDRLVDASKKYGFQIVKHMTGNNKYSNDFGVAAMEFPMRMGGIRFPGSTARDREKFEDLYNQLGKWQPNKSPKQLIQDCVMALWFGWYWIVKYRRTGGGHLDYRIHPSAVIPQTDPSKILRLPYPPTRL